MAHIIYDKFLNDVLLGNVNLINDDIRCALLKGTYIPDTSHKFWSDVSSNEVTGNGYQPGGKQLQNKVIISGKYFDSDDVIWPNSTIQAAKYIILYNLTPPIPSLITCFDLMKNKNTDNTDFVIQWGIKGIFILMQGV